MEELIKKRKITHFKNGQVVFEEGEKCNSIGIILNGEVSIYTSSSNDSSFTIDTLKKNEFLGAALIFSSSPINLGYGIAVKDSDICFIPKNEFLNMLSLNKELLLAFLNFVSDKRLKVQERVKILSQKTIRDKIMFLLNDKMDENNIYYFETKEALAQYLNIPRPSLSRTLIALEKDKIITYGRHYIKVLNKRG